MGGGGLQTKHKVQLQSMRRQGDNVGKRSVHRLHGDGDCWVIVECYMRRLLLY